MAKYRKIAFIFPGQGAQYAGMVKDFVENFAEARETLEEADDILGRKLSTLILEGPDSVLTETKNSQVGIYVASLATRRVLNKLFPDMKPAVCAGLSLGEYTALTASGRLSFEAGVKLVQQRGQLMNEACEATQGTMAVVLGLDAKEIEAVVKEVNMPQDIWAANFNCPGQVVISGTLKGIEAGTQAAKSKGAKRVLPLQVHGAFHSGLMQMAEDKLREHILHAPLSPSEVALVMNVTGDFARDEKEIRENLIRQVTQPVRWEQGIRKMGEFGVDLFVEIGCGKTLSGFNKRIGLPIPTISVEKVDELDHCVT
jgi:[acyl-carrier-protein] S-malonyltransferase